MSARVGKHRARSTTSPTRAVLRGWLAERGGAGDHPLVHPHRDDGSDTDAVERLVREHAATAAKRRPTIKPDQLHPHVLRHSCAMALLHAGVDTAVIALWLGHFSRVWIVRGTRSAVLGLIPVAVGASAYRATCVGVSDGEGGGGGVCVAGGADGDAGLLDGGRRGVAGGWLSADSFLASPASALPAPRAPPAPMPATWRAICGGAWIPRDLPAGARELWMFVAMLKTTPVDRPGAGRGRARGPGRINHVLAVVREFYKHAVADGALMLWRRRRCTRSATTGTCPRSCDQRVPGCVTGSALRHVQRARRAARRRRYAATRCRPPRARHLGVIDFCWCCCGSAACGCVALGLRWSDDRIWVLMAAAQGCAVPGPHLPSAGTTRTGHGRSPGIGRCRYGGGAVLL